MVLHDFIGRGLRIVIILVLGSMLISGAEAWNPYEFALKIPSVQWYFDNPSGIAVDRDGNVYVADDGNHRVQKFNSSGGFLTKWGDEGSGKGQFNDPSGIAVDNNGNVYVADDGNHRIQKFSSSGDFLAEWGSFGSGDGQFNDPEGVAVDSLGNVYVADSNNHRIQKFNSSGGFLAKWGLEGNNDGQFNYPEGVAVDSGGNVYGQFNDPEGIAVDRRGNVYVADTKAHRIQKFSPGMSPPPLVPELSVLFLTLSGIFVLLIVLRKIKK